MSTAVAVHRQVRVTGVVQGVGFRPFVHALATRLGLSGSVLNDVEGVLADVHGDLAAVEAFCALVRDEAPPLASVMSVTWTDLDPEPGELSSEDAALEGFSIVLSDVATVAAAGRRTLVPPDVATCEDCLGELADPQDRRYRHPFVSCTNCGPRYTIVTGLPYDRPNTTMAGFPLCPDCAREYADPADRRFHAQPIACHACGPVLDLHEPRQAQAQAQSPEPVRREAALQRAREILAAGGIVAVKGLGGYHLACDATDPAAVRRLRERKRRGDKPFAVLVADVAAARALVELDDVAERLLASPRRPIVLLRRRGDVDGAAVVDRVDVAAEVAPRSDTLGVMLPPTALHHLLLGLPGEQRFTALVLTSGNLSGEPIVVDDEQALERLDGIADAWLRHDRAIHVPCDDSVVTVVDGEELPIRRSRGYAPMPVALPVDVAPSLAVGGDLKNTFCVGQGRRAWLSGHIGDMDDLATQETFEHAVAGLTELVQTVPDVVVADRHPGYRSTRWAQREATGKGLAGPVLVQHHHAHVASVMAENGIEDGRAVLGIAFDGTGFGDDGAVWGGELLRATYDGFERLAHLSYVPLPGGDAAVRRPYRMALSHLRSAGIDWDPGLPCVAACPDDERAVLARQLERNLACVPTSSAGRLFDAVASIAGVCHEVGYEAQAAMELQASAERAERAGGQGRYVLPLVDGVGRAPAVWDVAVLVRAVADDVLAGAPAGVVALRFHRALADAVVAAARRFAAPGDPVALSGGVLCNALLLRLAVRGLRDNGFPVLRHRQVPPNDGGLALGQLVVGARTSTTTHDRSTTTHDSRPVR